MRNKKTTIANQWSVVYLVQWKKRVEYDICQSKTEYGTYFMRMWVEQKWKWLRKTMHELRYIVIYIHIYCYILHIYLQHKTDLAWECKCVYTWMCYSSWVLSFPQNKVYSVLIVLFYYTLHILDYAILYYYTIYNIYINIFSLRIYIYDMYIYYAFYVCKHMLASTVHMLCLLPICLVYCKC